MSIRDNNQVETVLKKLSEGDIIELTYEDSGRFSSNKDTVELIVVEVPSKPTKSVTGTYTRDADLEKDAGEIIEDGADHVNIQSARKNSSAYTDGYRYEIRCISNDLYDAKAIKNINIIGRREI
jgi:hypothetical protein